MTMTMPGDGSGESSSSADTTSDTSSAAGSGDTGATSTATATPAAPSLADIQRAKFEGFRLKNAERKAALESTKLDERAKAVAEQETAAKGRLAAYDKDPVAALEAAGFSPLQALDALVARANEEERPVTRAELAAHEKKMAAWAAKVEAMEAETTSAKKAAEDAERAKGAQQREAEARASFVNVVKAGEKYKALEAYTPDELIGYGDRIASDWLAEGKRFTLTDVADRLLEGHAAMVRRFSPANGVSDTTSASASAPATVNGGRPAPRTLTTQLATDATARSAAVEHRETTPERIERLRNQYSKNKLR